MVVSFYFLILYGNRTSKNILILYFITSVGLTAGGNSTVHIYT